MARSLIAAMVLLAGLLAGCHTTHTVKVEPIEVKPIHVTMDVNIRVDKDLDDFFDFQDEFEATDAPAGEGGAR